MEQQKSAIDWKSLFGRLGRGSVDPGLNNASRTGANPRGGPKGKKRYLGNSRNSVITERRKYVEQVDACVNLI
jgi:hypothetical protein